MASSGFNPVSVGLAGLGGYAGSVRMLLEECAQPAYGQQVRLAAVCDPDLAAHRQTVDRLKAANVKVCPDLQAMLELPIEAVWLPLPIDLHASATMASLKAGKAVMVEKPAAGSLDDVDAMIAARDAANLPVLVGFQDIYDSSTPSIKRRLMQGAIGQVTHADVLACWPRDQRYYQRSDWAGRLKRSGGWVLDGPLNNALAHYVNLVLFWLGGGEATSAIPVALQVERYRANAIETEDTVVLRATLDNGAVLRVLLTHACRTTVNPRIVLGGTQGRMTWSFEQGIEFFDRDGESVHSLVRDGQARRHMVRSLAHQVRRAGPSPIAAATLEVARAHSLLVSAVVQASPVHEVPASLIHEVDHEGSRLRYVAGIEELFARCLAVDPADANFGLSALGDVSWAQSASRMDLTGYRHFAGPCPCDDAAIV